MLMNTWAHFVFYFPNNMGICLSSRSKALGMMMVDAMIVVAGGVSVMAAMTLAVGRTRVTVMAVLLDAGAHRRWVERPVLLLHVW
jgi:hypothetical protein